MTSRARRFIATLIFATALCLLVTTARSVGDEIRRLTNTAHETFNLNPTLSGDGGRVVFESSADLAATRTGRAFHVVAADTAAPLSFKELAPSRGPAPSLSQDGARAAFACKDDPLGENRDGNSEIFFHDGARLSQLTRTLPDDPAQRASQGSFQPSLSDDGRLVAFASNRDLAGANADHSSEIFLFDTETQRLTQITAGDGAHNAVDAKISGDGSRVAFIRERPTNADGTTLSDIVIHDIASVETVASLNNLEGLALTYGRAISDDGLRLVYSARGPNRALQVFLLDGRNNFAVRQLTQLGTRSTDVPLHATISGDGNRVAFATRRNVIGGNSDASVELYLYDIPTSRFSRITDAPAAATAEVVSSLSDDGTLVAFNFPRALVVASAPTEFANNSEIFLAQLAPRAPSETGLQFFNGAIPSKTPPGAALASDSIALVKGNNLALSQFEAERLPGGAFPTRLQNVTATVGGSAAQIFFVSPTQINLHVPAGISVGPAEVTIRNPDGMEIRGTLTIARTGPGIFTTSGTGAGEAIALNNFTLQPSPFDATDALGNPRRLIIFCTGIRNASNVEALVGGRNVKVEAVVPSPDLPGLDQLHIALPSSLKGAGAASLVIRAEGIESNRATLTISGGGAPPRPARVELSPTSATIPVGGELRFRVRAFDSLGEEIENPIAAFASSDASIATIEGSGLAKGLAHGTANIRATVGVAAADAQLRVVSRTLVINEVLADPPDGLAGDANHDGTRSGSEDEFIELVNGTDSPLNVEGWTVRTRPLGGVGESVRHIFPTGSAIPAGDALVLFGGGAPDASNPVFGGALVGRVSSSGLSLTNTGLTVLV
ncbi:MAG TPA: lamin tail domain-containing protein, partial [Pyrinomonadaceae bacterium]|nr:lamin tail domain-containing protein [Pyrinomonadaceae bacterium]